MKEEAPKNKKLDLAPHEVTFHPFEEDRTALEAAETYKSGNPIPPIVYSDGRAMVMLLKREDLSPTNRLILEHKIGYAEEAADILMRAPVVGDPDFLTALYLTSRLTKRKETTGFINDYRAKKGLKPLNFSIEQINKHSIALGYTGPEWMIVEQG